MACEGHHVGLTCLSTWKYWDTRGNQKSYLCEIPNILREIVKRSQRFTVELQNYLLEKFGSNQGGKANSPWLWSVVIWLFPKDGENGLRLPEMPWGSWSGVMTCMFDAVLLDVCVCALSRSWLFETPWAVACQAPLSMEFSRQGYWSVLPFPSPGNLPDPGIKPRFLVLGAESLPSEPPGKPSGVYMSIPISQFIPPSETVIIQSEVNQKEKNKYQILMDICGI